jgi:hypothetical protein
LQTCFYKNLQAGVGGTMSLSKVFIVQNIISTALMRLIPTNKPRVPPILKNGNSLISNKNNHTL